jgi:hypothetical protein
MKIHSHTTSKGYAACDSDRSNTGDAVDSTKLMCQYIRTTANVILVCRRRGFLLLTVIITPSFAQLTKQRSRGLTKSQGPGNHFVMVGRHHHHIKSSNQNGRIIVSDITNDKCKYSMVITIISYYLLIILLGSASSFRCCSDYARTKALSNQLLARAAGTLALSYICLSVAIVVGRLIW